MSFSICWLTMNSCRSLGIAAVPEVLLAIGEYFRGCGPGNHFSFQAISIFLGLVLLALDAKFFLVCYSVLKRCSLEILKVTILVHQVNGKVFKLSGSYP